MEAPAYWKYLLGRLVWDMVLSCQVHQVVTCTVLVDGLAWEKNKKMPSDPVPVTTNYLATNPGLKPAQNHQTANCFDKKSPCLQMFCFPRVFAKVKGIHPAQSSMPLFNTMGTLGTASGRTARIWELVASYIILNQAGQKKHQPTRISGLHPYIW